MQFKTRPMQHQLELFNKEKDSDYIGVFWEMGTGKTKFAIDWLRYKFYINKTVLSTLIIVPKIGVLNWKDEFDKHSSSSSFVYPLLGSGTKRVKLLDTAPKEAIFVTNYEMIRTLLPAFMARQFVAIIVDESHRIKNPHSKTTKAILELSQYCKYRLALSGTPIPNNALDIWSQAMFLDKGETFGISFYGFRNKYFENKNAGNPFAKYPKYDLIDGMIPIINAKIKAFGSRKLKTECLDLPEKVYETVYLTMDMQQKRVYKELVEDLITYLENEAAVADTAAVKAIRINQVSSGFLKTEEGKEIRFKTNPKIIALKSIIEDLPIGTKVIIWACFRNNIFQLLEEFKDYNPASIFGDTKNAYEQEQKFRNDPNCSVMIANPQSASVAINLVEASYAFYFSQGFNLVHRLQSEDRNHRSGSQIHTKVTYYDFIFPKTIDELIISRLKQKEDLSNNLLAELNSWLGGEKVVD